MKKSDWTKALTSMKETLEPPPKSERKARSRALVEDYASEPIPVSDSSDGELSSPSSQEITPAPVSPVPGIPDVPVPGVPPVSHGPSNTGRAHRVTNERRTSRPKGMSREQGQGAAPARDFTRVANSIVREAVAGGHFKGKSKQLYDYLYSQTRGYITPRYTARLTRTQIMAGAGIGSINTFMSHIAHLKEKGLLAVKFINGTQGGNSYTLYLPEEVGLREPVDQYQVYQVYQDHQHQELVGVPVSGSATGETGQPPLDSVNYTASKTFIKTEEIIDDESTIALSSLNRIFGEATSNLTGHTPRAGEQEQWAELAEVLVTELKIAAARTTVSSVPSFLAEHLRRRLWKVDKHRAQAEGNNLPDETMKNMPSEDISKCLDCGGTGWWYPKGMDRGVKKCTHEKLKTQSETE
jgi:hypothetical protein